MPAAEPGLTTLPPFPGSRSGYPYPSGPLYPLRVGPGQRPPPPGRRRRNPALSASCGEEKSHEQSSATRCWAGGLSHRLCPAAEARSRPGLVGGRGQGRVPRPPPSRAPEAAASGNGTGTTTNTGRSPERGGQGPEPGPLSARPAAPPAPPRPTAPGLHPPPACRVVPRPRLPVRPQFDPAALPAPCCGRGV